MATFPRLTIAGFVLSLLTCIGIAAPATNVLAADNLTVAVTSLTREPSPDDPTETATNLVIKGQVKGISAATGQKLDLALMRSDAIRTRSAISDILQDPYGVTLRETIQTRKVTFSSTINTDGTVEWTAKFSVSDLLDQLGNGVYAFGISASVENSTGVSSFLFPWFPDRTSLDPTAISLVVPLAVFNNAPLGIHTPSEIERSELNRISQLISIEPKLAASITWAIDPSLVDWLDSLNDDQARSVKDAITELSGTRIALPYGLADVDALAQAELIPELTDLVSVSKVSTVTNSQTPSIYFTNKDKFDPTSIVSSKLNKDFIPVIANSDFGVSANSTVEATSKTNTVNVLTYDLAASECFNQAKANQFAAIQCLTSHIAMMTAEQPNRSRSVALVAPTDWDVESPALNSLIDSLTGQSWVALSSLTRSLNFDDAQSLSFSHNPTAGNIPAKNIKITRSLTTKADALAEVIDNPDFVLTYKQLVARTFSTGWSNQATAYQFGKNNLKNLQTLSDSIAINTSPSITIGSESASLPITVVNSSGYDVTVRVALTSTSPARFAPQTSEDIAIKNGQKVTVAIPITVYGAGRLSVAATLVSSHGKVVGSAQNIVITPTAYTRFASSIVVGALGLLVLLVIVRLVRRRLSGRKEIS